MHDSQTTIAARSSRLDGLDLLRLCAVTAVIFYHYGFWGPAAHGVPQIAIPALAPFAQYGFLGVPVFFIISGFVIAYSAEGRTAIGFGIARFARIYPTFVLCLTLTTASIAVFGGSNFGVTTVQWFANLAIWAPALGQSYVDGSYWSLVIEVIFYGWFGLFLAAGWLPKRIDVVILAWLAITFVNELTFDAAILEKVFITDDSGFFAVGLLFYEHFRGRRISKLYALFALAVGTSIFQAMHKIEKLGPHTGGDFDPNVAALICLASVVVVFWAIHLRRVLLPNWIVLAAGGITYPLYLLHMQLGYVFLLAIAPARYIEMWTAIIVLGVATLSWLIWRFAEYPLHTWTKAKITQYAASFGLRSRVAVTADA